MTTYCADSILPTFTSLSTMFSSIPHGTVLPEFPTFGNTSMGSIDIHTVKVSSFVQEFQKFSVLALVSTIASPIASILGGAVDDLLPKFPVLNIGFTAFMASNPATLYAGIKTELLNPMSGLWALIPSPIFGGISSLDLEIPEIVKNIVVSYTTDLVNTLTTMINAACVVMSIPPMSATPPIPTLASVETAIRDYLTDNGGTVQDAISSLFPLVPSPLFPSPFFGGFSSTEIELRHILNVLMVNLIMLPMQIITSFVEDAFGISLGVFCVAF